MNSQVTDYLYCVVSKWERMQHVDVSEANFHPINLENNRIWIKMWHLTKQMWNLSHFKSIKLPHEIRKHTTVTSRNSFFLNVGPNELDNHTNRA